MQRNEKFLIFANKLKKKKQNEDMNAVLSITQEDQAHRALEELRRISRLCHGLPELIIERSREDH